MASIHLLLVILALVASVSGETSLPHCKIDCSGYSTHHLTADPLDRHRFYLCTSKTTWYKEPIDCDTGLDFDINSYECMDPSDPKYKPTPPCDKCSFDCATVVDGKRTFLANCHYYIACIGGVDGDVKACSESTPYFDGITCQANASNCCTCQPHCTNEDIINNNFLPDKFNCTNFYLCIASGMIHSVCDEGNFDEEHQECRVGSPCKEECKNDGCVETLLCKQIGIFPKCAKSCSPHYFICYESQLGKEALILNCLDGNVLNPKTMTCIKPEDCPF
ncbi:uncharacterized protein LOC121879484 [Homarus americanus]|uniref:Putative Low-density lipoprotein receptor-related protein 8-like 4 n=1 Tax=Homarus americanus TaxID=6706 RepID=A0A8J5N8Y0_HOMAM|nr:uncharacterized protein LOC121879484 [Homarus americanus]XP_042242072.1 uncharacterized protein LOC121879484 [Homarus americanus]KAG7176136.1 putative Low-density lipoprotein receptor-related protein 8-like 4 [Homarus americanus]